MKNTASKVSTQATQHSQAIPVSLTREQISGSFSLIGNGPVVIDAASGATLHVRSGLVQVCHLEEEGQQLLQGGQQFVLNRNGPVGLAAIARAEVHLDWPRRIAASAQPRSLYAYA
jgi:hypothetical protein